MTFVRLIAKMVEKLHDGQIGVDVALVLFWAQLASGQIRMRKVDDWPSLAIPVSDQPVVLAA